MNKISSVSRLLLLSFAIAAIASCSIDTIDKIDNVPTEISFTTTTTTNATTKGAPVDDQGSDTFDKLSGLQYIGRAFGAWAYSVDNESLSLFFGSKDKSIKFNGTINGGRFEWAATQKLYWPHLKRTMNLFAYTPFEDNGQISVNTELLPKAMNIKYNTNGATDLENYKIDKRKFKTAISGTELDRTSIGKKGLQEDVMYAITRGFPTPFSQNMAEKTNTAPLHFKHTLTQIHFAAKTEPNVVVNIKSITLHNIKAEGTFEVAPSTYTYTNGVGGKIDGTTAGTWKTVELGTTNYYNVSLPWEGVNIIDNQPESGYTSLTTHQVNSGVVENLENTLMLIPQEVLPWQPAIQSIRENDAVGGSKGAYLRIYCDIAYKGKPYFPAGVPPAPNVPDQFLTPPSEHCIYVPFTSLKDGVNSWKAGNRITYYLLFGGGYSEEGDVVLNPVSINISIDQWGAVGIFDEEGNLLLEGSSASGSDLDKEIL